MTPQPPKRIQLRRTKGWRKPADAIVVARPSKWGNPYRVLPHGANGWKVRGNGTSMFSPDPDNPISKVQAAEWAVDGFRRMYPDGSNNAYMARIMLAGKDLACWCPLLDEDGNKFPCHADVLLSIANPQPPSGEDN